MPREEIVPCVLGDDADRKAVCRIGAGVRVEHEDIFVAQILVDATEQRLESVTLEGLVRLAPVDVFFAAGFADEELVLRRSPGVLSGSNDERASRCRDALAPADRLLEKRRDAQIARRRTNGSESESFETDGFAGDDSHVGGGSCKVTMRDETRVRARSSGRDIVLVYPISSGA